jgi:nucleotide-binding universal stress UspA family protein
MALRILVATDGSDPSRKVSELAIRLSRVLPLDIDVALAVDLHRVEYKMLADMYVKMIREGATATAEETLRKEAEHFRSQGVPLHTRILEGQPGPAICDAATSGDYALVLVGRKGKGGDIQDILFGSVSNWVVHNCKKPVLVAKVEGPIRPAEAAGQPVRVLVGVDGSAGAQRAVDFLRWTGLTKGLEITLLSVVNPDKAALEHLPGQHRYDALEYLHREAQALLDRSTSPLRKEGFRVATRVEEGTPAKTICRVYQEDEYEIVVMGHRGMTELGDALFGSVSNFVLHHCPGHTLMVP